MLVNDLSLASDEWMSAGEPLKYNDGERVLITGLARPAINLLRRHIWECTRYIVDPLGIKLLDTHGDTEVGEEYHASFPQQHIFRLDVPVNHLSVVRIL